MEFLPTVAMAALVVSLINFIKYLKARDVNGIVTTLSVWIAGVVVVFLVAQTDFAAGIVVAGTALSVYNSWSLLFLGLSISTLAQFANEIRGAVDNHDSTAKPDLVGGNVNTERVVVVTNTDA